MNGAVSRTALGLMLMVSVFILFSVISCDSVEKKVARAQTVVHVTATQLHDTYCDNKIYWLATYKNQIIAVTGYIRKVGIDWLTDTPYVSLVSGSPFTAVYCAFSKSATDSLLNLHTGGLVTIRGLCTGKPLNIELTGCMIVRR
jgi:hypothetical protein